MSSTIQYTRLNNQCTVLQPLVDAAFIQLCNREITADQYRVIAEPYWAVVAAMRAHLDEHCVVGAR